MDTDDYTRVRIAENQATFRDANERIEAAARELEIGGEVPFICECADAGCTEIVQLGLSVYAEVRRHERRFFTVPGHQRLSVESGAGTVVGEGRGYVLVDKVGIAGDVAAGRDPE